MIQPAADEISGDMNSACVELDQHQLGSGMEVYECSLQGQPMPSAPAPAPAPSRPVHTYDDLFPALPKSPTIVATTVNNDNMRVGSSQCTQVFMIPFSERKQDHADKFGEGESVKTCQMIMRETGAHIEISGSRDQSLTFVVTGKKSAVLDARQRILSSFQTQASKQINIPKEHHKMIMGKAGQKLKDLEKSTATKISVPRQDVNSDVIVVTGTKEGIEKAEHHLRVTSDELSRKASECVRIPKIYHPFIVGAYNENLTAMVNETGARIHVPPPSVISDDIMIVGEKEGVLSAKAKVEAIWKEMEKKCIMVSVEVPKSQHKYVTGTRGAYIQDILKETGVYVEMPPVDSATGTINLRGPQDKLGLALTKVCDKANSQCASSVLAPAWIYKYIIGKKGANIKRITQDFPKVNLEFPEGEDKIKIEGPPEEVERAQVELDSLVKTLQETMTFADISVDSKYLKYIVGKNGANVTRLKDEHGVNIIITDNIRIEGSHEGVAAVQKELIEMIARMENEKEKDVIIDHRYFKKLIGNKGENMKEIKEKFNNQVQIFFPNQNEKLDIVRLKGPRDAVDQCYKHLQKVVKELTESSYVQEVPVFKQFHRYIIGKGGVNIRKIREETQTRIDLPAEGNTSDKITITGKKENVEEAIKMIQKIHDEFANIVTVEVNISPKFHKSLIGAKGKLVNSMMGECGGVSIKFPHAESNSDKVTITGPAENVEKAKGQLLELASEKQLSLFTAEVRANPQHHKYLIGKTGAKIKKIRDQTGARIIFPGELDVDKEVISIVGRQEAVEEAKKLLEANIYDFDNSVEGETEVDVRHHKHFVARRGEVLNRISEDCGGVQISFPRHGVDSTRVVLKGPKECIDAAIQRIHEIVSELESQVTIDCVIPQKFHRSVMGAKGCKVQGISAEYNVQIKFPDRDTNTEKPPLVNGGSVNGDSENGETNDDTPRPCDIIRIHGRIESCNAARQALLDQIPVTIEVECPYDVQRSIIGLRGQGVRELQGQYDVHIVLSPQDQRLDTIKITGTVNNVEEAKKAIEERCRSAFEVKLEVDPEYHPMVIGRGGTVISKIRTTHNVHINLPKKGDPEENIITIQGLEEDVMGAREAIMKIVTGLSSMIKEEVRIDTRIHSRLIGARGRKIKQIMSEYKVDIKFPRGNGDPEIVTILGNNADAVQDARCMLENLQEEFLQDLPPAPSQEEQEAPVVQDVGGANWEAPNTASTMEFPTFIPPSTEPPPPVATWGPRR